MTSLLIMIMARRSGNVKSRGKSAAKDVQVLHVAFNKSTVGNLKIYLAEN